MKQCKNNTIIMVHTSITVVLDTTDYLENLQYHPNFVNIARGL